jgi:hypothetical protein
MTPPALAQIDACAFYERFVTIAEKPTNHYKEGKEWPCSCPQCGGTDRASFWESGRFCCVRGCQAHASNPYWFLIDVLHYDHLQAMTECDDMMFQLDFLNREPVRLPLFLTRDEPPCSAWQDAARAFCHAAEKCLWGPKGESALRYLHSRGLRDEIIRQAQMGLCPDWYKAPLEHWGLSAEQLGKSDDPQIKIPRGIVIPWFVGGQLWKIQLRRPEPGPDGKKYKEILGSSECLYNVDSLKAGQPALLAESELDALSAQQEAGDLVSCLATGSASKGQQNRLALARLRTASIVLQAFDDDAAGEAGAEEWREALPEGRCTRWAPLAHDINQMLQEGQPVREWVVAGLQMISPDRQPEQGGGRTPEPPPALSWPWWEDHLHSMEERIAAFQARPCASCGGREWMMDEDGLLVCPCIVPKRMEARLLNL